MVLGGIDILTMQILKIHEHKLSLHLFVLKFLILKWGALTFHFALGFANYVADCAWTRCPSLGILWSSLSKDYEASFDS